MAKVNANLLDESDEDGEEEYEPQFDEDEDDDNEAPVQQMLNKSKPSMSLGPVNEEVKEMKKETAHDKLKKLNGWSKSLEDALKRTHSDVFSNPSSNGTFKIKKVNDKDEN